MPSTRSHCLFVRAFGLFLGGILLGTTWCRAADSPIPAPPDTLDAAPFAVGVVKPAENEADRAYGVYWGEPRKIRRLDVEFEPGATLPPLDKVRVQYWHKSWNGRPNQIQAETGAAGAGWDEMDDWTNGQWRDADARVQADGPRWSFTFAPTGEKEFPNIGPGVGYRRTLKIRVIASEGKLPKPRQFRAFTDAVYRPLTVRIVWDKPAVERLRFDGENTGRLEVFNGSVLAVRPYLDPAVKVAGDRQFTLPANTRGGIEADLMMAVDPIDGRYDRTVVTVRTAHNPFSFAAADAARGAEIGVEDLGVLAVRGDDASTVESWRQARREFPGKTVYDRVTEHGEQSLPHAWNDMPVKRPLWFVHGLPGNRNAVKHEPNGDITLKIMRHWFQIAPSDKDTSRKLWSGEFLRLEFGFPPEERRVNRELREGCLPQLRTCWIDGPLCYEQSAILDTLSGELGDVQLDDPTLLLMRIRVVNTSASEKGVAHLRLGAYDDRADKNGQRPPQGMPEKLTLEGDRVYGERPNEKHFRYVFRTGGQGETKQAGDGIDWAAELAPGQTVELLAMAPTITLTEPKELDALNGRDFESASRRVCDFWRKMSAEGTQIDTPEPWLNDFYRAMVRHNEVNCVRDLKTSRRYARVGSFVYAEYANESIMMLADIERRGKHKMAEDCLQTFLDFQGTCGLPGNYTDSDGVFYGAGGYECGGYNKHHGYVLYGMAEHWRFTRDRQWMEKAAPKLVKACDWVTRQRRQTMKDSPDGTRPIEYGFLPPGGLEDVQDYWYWLATNVNTSWGFTALAEALADFGHIEGARLQQDAKAYRDDVLGALTEARIRTPVVRLRDGTYVPKYPSHLHERGRAAGWIRETLEGSLFLLIDRLIPPDAPEAAWILRDYEDNLYISSEGFGYSIPAFDLFWFSRGGFTMQSNLLDGPIPYLDRDQIKHYLRAYFNGFAAAFYPEIRMCNEHSIPELGYPYGDHFKSSDESNVTCWLRMMFVHEQGDDLYLGRAIPRYWLTQGRHVAIDRAASYFGPLSLRIVSNSDQGQITATVTPPERNPPKMIYVRIRHPQEKKIQGVTLNGKDYDKFDASKEWVILPGSVQGPQEIVVKY